MNLVAAGLYVIAYLSAVVDGAGQPAGLYAEADTGRYGLRRYASEHRWIVFGALCGLAGTALAVLAA